MPVRPLVGIRVIDLAVDRGELCGRLLSDLGAEVVRVEPPEGSPSRRLPPLDPLTPEHSLFFTMRNCGKLSVVLDLDDDADRDRFEALLASADVLVDSAEPAAHAAAGRPALESEQLAARHSHLVVASVTAYGRIGPHAGRDVPGSVIDATSGMCWKAGLPEREPLMPPGDVSGDVAGLIAAFASVCALIQRCSHGAGQLIDVSANEAAAQITDWSLPNASRTIAAGADPAETRAGPGPVYTILAAADGFVRLVVLSPRQWRAIRAWLGEPDYLQDPEYDGFMGRFMIADAVLNPLYEELFSTMTMEEVAEEAQRRGIVATPILKPGDVIANHHFDARNTFDRVPLSTGGLMSMPSGWMEIDGKRIGPTGPPPRLGQHTKTVLATLADPSARAARDDPSARAAPSVPGTRDAPDDLNADWPLIHRRAPSVPGAPSALDDRGTRGAPSALDDRGTRGAPSALDDRGTLDARGDRGTRGAPSVPGTRDTPDDRGTLDALDARGTPDDRGALDVPDARGALDDRGIRGALDDRGIRGALDDRGTLDALDDRGTLDALDAFDDRGTRGAPSALDDRGTLDALDDRGTRAAPDDRGARCAPSAPSDHAARGAPSTRAAPSPLAPRDGGVPAAGVPPGAAGGGGLAVESWRWPPVPDSAPEPALPLVGLRVADFGHGGVGVEMGRMLAEHGADVIKVESRSYPDFIRVVLGGEMSPSFASSSRSKRGLGVDAKTDEGRRLLLELAAGAGGAAPFDVVIENGSTGVMDGLGLGYRHFSQANPGVIMVSSQLMGSSGPWSAWRGYGPNTQVTGGMTHLWDYPDAARPSGSQSIFPDHWAGRMGALAAVAGVLARRRGVIDGGYHAEVCQVEQVVGVMGDLLARESLQPGSVGPQGNRRDRGSPWGLFPCDGADQWVAVCCRSDAEWAALAALTGADDPSLATLDARRRREDEVEEAVSAWTRRLSKHAVTDACLLAGVPAGPMLTSKEQLQDPHLAARGYLVELDQPPIGKMTFEGQAFIATGMPGPDVRPAPALGQHTREIVSELGLNDTTINHLITQGVLETQVTPPAASPNFGPGGD